MKKYIIFLCLYCCLSPTKLSGQIVSYQQGDIEFARDQYAVGNYKVALKEFLRVHYFDRKGIMERTTKDVAFCFSHLGNTDQALKYLSKYLRISDLTDKEIAEASYKRVEIYLSYNPALALVDLFQFEETLVKVDSDRFNYYLSIAQLMSDDFSAGFSAVKNLSYFSFFPHNDLLDLKEQLEKNHNKNHFVARILSTLLPGLGQTVNGEPKDGINSLLINSAMLVLFFNVKMNLGATDAVISVLPWFGRFYVGGMQNAISASYKKQARTKKELLTEFNGLVREAKEKQSAGL